MQNNNNDLRAFKRNAYLQVSYWTVEYFIANTIFPQMSQFLLLFLLLLLFFMSEAFAVIQSD